MPDLPDPIQELQALAKANDVNDDDPPFNFQAMLKKTPRNRASMKRSGENENNILEGRQSAPQYIIGYDKGRAPPPKQADYVIDNKNYEKIQLAPGITVEGTVIDL